MKIIIDTGAFLALQVKKDPQHAPAQKHFTHLKKKRSLFFTSDYVLAETYTRLIYDVRLEAASKFHQYIIELLEKEQLSLIEIDYQDYQDREQAWEELKRYSDHKPFFTDATIIANFKNYHLGQIFTFGKHFQEINLPTNLG